MAEQTNAAFRAGDHVHHHPSGEHWLLACDESDGYVLPGGWPETMARSSDCTLLKAATDEERLKTLREVAKSRCVTRSSWARQQLEAMEPKAAPGTANAKRAPLFESDEFSVDVDADGDVTLYVGRKPGRFVRVLERGESARKLIAALTRVDFDLAAPPAGAAQDWSRELERDRLWCKALLESIGVGELVIDQVAQVLARVNALRQDGAPAGNPREVSAAADAQRWDRVRSALRPLRTLVDLYATRRRVGHTQAMFRGLLALDYTPGLEPVAVMANHRMRDIYRREFPTLEIVSVDELPRLFGKKGAIGLDHGALLELVHRVSVAIEAQAPECDSVTSAERMRDELRSLEGAASHGCLTGDCPHGNANECVKSLGETMSEIEDGAKSALAGAPPESKASVAVEELRAFIVEERDMLVDNHGRKDWAVWCDDLERLCTRAATAQDGRRNAVKPTESTESEDR